MMNAAIEKILNEHLTPSGDYIYSFANLSGLLIQKFKAYPYGISIIRKLDDKIVDGISFLRLISAGKNAVNSDEHD